MCSQVLLLGFAALVIWFLVRRSEQTEIENKQERKEIRAEMEMERVNFTAIINGYRENLGRLSESVEGINRSLTEVNKTIFANKSKFAKVSEKPREIT